MSRPAHPIHGMPTGHTLVETMVVLGIAGVFAMLSAVAFLGLAKRNEALAARVELAGVLRLARHLAMSERQAIRVRVEGDGSRIVTTRAAGTEEPGRVLDWSRKSVRVSALSNGPDIWFYPSGRSATPTTITLHDARDGRTYQLTVSLTGRVTIK